MSVSETVERTVGLLTAVYSEKNSTPEEFQGLIKPFLDDLLTARLHLQLDGINQDPRSIANAVAQAATKEMSPKMQASINTLLVAFVLLAKEYEKDCPNADIFAFLQKFALYIVADD
jgi:hypothetical protein